MKIFGRKINNRFLSILWKGKPKTIEPKDEEEMRVLIEDLKRSIDGDHEAINRLEEILFKDEKDLIKDDEDLIDKSNKMNELDTEIVEDEKNLEFSKKYDEILKSNLFEVKQDGDIQRVYLKGFNSDIPPLLVDEFIKRISNKQDIEPLVNFWKLNLMNENTDARRGLYKFIKNQKLLITKDGYFVGFRKVVRVNNVKKEINLDIESSEFQQINEFFEKIKRWKKGINNYVVLRNINTNTLVLKSVKSQDINKDSEYIYIGTLREVDTFIKSDNEVSEDIFTDDWTKSMVIKIGEPVKKSRSLCDKNPNNNCSHGLHIGNQSFVAREGFGDTRIAVLVNPQHVVSVPYSDAYKMRVCEYFPFKIITKDELISFNSDAHLDKYSNEYKRIEKIKMDKAIAVLDQLNDSDLKNFSSVLKSSNVDENLINKKRDEVEKYRNSLKNILEDDISSSIDLSQIKEIIKSRVS